MVILRLKLTFVEKFGVTYEEWTWIQSEQNAQNTQNTMQEVPQSEYVVNNDMAAAGVENNDCNCCNML